MEVDCEISTTSGLVRDTGAIDRCVGVLTKPDRLPSDSFTEQWQAILDGTKFPLKHGYFVTKQPSQKDLLNMINYEEARRKENEFFNSEDWHGRFKAPRGRDQIGTLALQKYLPTQLASLIKTTLPHIREGVERRLHAIDSKLRALPEPEAHPRGSILAAIREVANLMKD